MPLGAFKLNSLAKYSAPASSSRTAKTVTAQGNAKVSTADYKFGGASAYFDGTGDYLEVSSNFSWHSASAGTIEFWTKFTDTTPFASGLISQVTQGSGTGWELLRVQTKLYWYKQASGGTAIASSGTVAANTWYHIAIVKESSTVVKLYINGTLNGTDSSASGYTDIATNLWIGRGMGNSSSLWDATRYDHTGYIDEIRISNTARYTANFTPTTTPFTDDSNTLLLIHCNGINNATTFTDDVSTPASITGPFTSDANTLFLLHFDGANNSTTITDSGPNNKTFTRVTGNLTTSYYKFGTAGWSSPYNSNGYFTYSEVISGTGDFTMEGWFYQTNRGNYVTTFGTYIGCYIDINGYPGFYSGGYRNGSIQMALNTWTHIAYVRASSVVTIYVNGLESARFSNTTSFSTGTMGIGANADGSYGYNTGYFDEIRYSNIARYTAPFTIN